MKGRKRCSFLLLLAILVSGLLLGIGMRLVVWRGKLVVTHDEAISFLAASGHQAEYDQMVRKKAPPSNVWVPAAEWKRYLNVEQPFCFREIGRGLAHHDIHPPLYFWLLHFPLLLLGAQLGSGLLLNLVFDLLTFYLLYRFAAWVFGSKIQAALASAVWFISPAVVGLSSVARQYALLALLGMLFCYVWLRIVEREREPSFRHYALAGVATMLLALTHYQAAFLVAGCWVYLALTLGWRAPRRVLYASLALGAGCLGFAALHPEFLLSIRRQQGMWHGGHYGSFWDQCYRVQIALAEGIGRSKGEIARALPLLGLLLGGYLLFLGLRGKIQLRQENRRPIFLAFITLWTWGCIVGMYLLRITPPHAMGDRYLALVWPLLACAVVGLANLPGRAVKPVLMVFLVLLMLGSWRTLNRHPPRHILQIREDLAHAPRVLLDGTGRGKMPPLLFHIPDQTPVLAAEKKDLASPPQAWADGWASPGLYVSLTGGRSLGAEKVAAMEQKILARLEQLRPNRLDYKPPGAQCGYKLQEPSAFVSTGDRGGTRPQPPTKPTGGKQPDAKPEALSSEKPKGTGRQVVR